MNRKFVSDRPEVVVHPPVLFLVAIVIGGALEYFFPTELLHARLRWWAGGAMLALGLALIMTSSLQFIRAKTNIPTFKPATALVTSGLYGLSRNPIYIGLVACHLAVALLADSLWILAGVPVVALVLDRGVILREETYLEDKFGEDYRNYKSKVRRWI